MLDARLRGHDKTKLSMIQIGCGEIPKPRAQYFRLFKTAEIQDTFYQLPLLRVADDWKTEAPPEFEFSIKAWQLITHPATSPTYDKLLDPVDSNLKPYYGLFQLTPEVQHSWARTLEFARRLHAKAILFQCPGSFEPTPKNKQALTYFFKSIPKLPIKMAIELRGKWKTADVEPLVKQFQLVHAVDPFQQESASPDFCYFRLFGPKGFRSSYALEDLKELVTQVRRFRRGYVFFNNISMWDDAKRFQEMLNEPQE